MPDLALDPDPAFDAVAELAIIHAAQQMERDDPEQYRDILLLHQSRCRGFEDMPYRIAPYVTEDLGLWEYARRRLAYLERRR